MFIATPDQIAAWKQEHGDVFRFKSEAHKKAAYYRKPKRKEMSYLTKIKDGTQFNAQLLKSCYLAGDKEIETNDDIFLGLGDNIIELLKFAKVEVEKL
ncbi:hypothetical protein HSX10_03675 [Winogradskyella undariae]|uniref:hypothetical protein n=1 Tax=Winogradskyella undariae TaxID=1285465 RepID=UPI00156A7F0F|nr:hypothetical protein [Winogradskyella undariae]NRR90659.1 hypothetical protein [Winogradskyella undariae]